MKTNRVISHLSSFFTLIVLLIFSLATPLQAQTPTGYWKFDEGSGTAAADSSGNAHTALLSNGINWVAGTNGGAISAEAANRDSVIIPAIDLRATHAVTIAFWTKRIYSTAGGNVLLEAAENYQDSTTGLALFPDDDTCHGIQAALRGNEGTTANCYSQPSSGIWHHLAVVFDKSQTGGNQVAFYVDGALQTPSWNLSAFTNTNTFGNDPIYLFSRGGTSQFSSGTVGDLRMYNHALTAAQIQQIYNGSELPSPSGLINYVQGNYATPQSSPATVNVTFTAAQVAGDLNVVVVGWHDSTATVSAVTDSRGNTYTRAVGPTVVRGALSQSIYYAKNIASAGAGANTVTVTFSRAAFHPDIRILEYSGADPANPVDVTVANSGQGLSSSSGSATTTNPTDLIFGGNTVTTRTIAAGNNFASRLLTQPDGDIAEDRTVTATGSYSATATVIPFGQWIMQMVAFRALSNFTISASPASLGVAQGTQGSSTITTAISGGFNNAISLSASGMPNGVTVSFNPTSIPAPGSGSSAMTITVGSSTPTGTYPITVTGNGGGIQQTTTVTLTVTAPANFTISASPASLSIAQGTQGNSTITSAISGGFNNAISLSASGMPSGTTVSFNPQTIPAPGSGSSAMTITVGSSTPTGTYPITVTGNGGGIQQTAIVTLTVTAPANFTISAAPASLSVAQGTQGSSTITTAVSGGFNNVISLAASGMPNGTTVSFNPTSIPAPGSGSSAMTITVGSSTPTGTYPITVTGNGGGIQQSTTVTLTVTTPPSFTISASPSSLSIGQGTQGSSTITTAISGGFNSAISLAASGMPNGTTVSFNPTSIPAPGSGSSAMTITVGSSTATGTYPISVTGNGGGIQQSTTVTLTVTTPPSFTISASPSSLTIMQGNQGGSTITTAISGGFNSAISLSATGVPVGTTVAFNPTSIPAPGSGSSAMTITVGSNTPMGSYSITVAGTGGGTQQTVTVNLTVTAQVILSWTASTSPGIAGYNAYRSTTSGGPYAKLNSSLIPTTAYNDLAVQNGYTYYYVTTAVDNQGMESGYSNESSATVP